MNSPVEEIKSRLDLVEFIQSYIRLHKAGINYKAPCPFHTEKTPSFFVSPARQIWHCFGGCQKGGDIFKFVMEIEGLDFPDALRLLAQRAGVVLKREDPAIRSERNRLYDLCEEAAKVFEKSLSLTPAAQGYLQKRSVDGNMLKEFRIGFAPQSWDFLLKALRIQGFKTEEVEKAGLAIKSEDGISYYDRFRSRIMFPVTDINGSVVGFGGRIFESLPSSSGRASPQEGGEAVRGEAKYVNTPNTLIYDKSRILYGFDKAKQEIRTKNAAILVEGYMDCIMSHQAGVKNAVAVSGTALTSYQLKNLRRLCDRIVSSFDTDAAGDSATKRSLELASHFEFEQRVAAIPTGKDPADTVAENPHAWVDAVSNAKPVVDFYFEKAFSDNNSITPEGKKAISSLLLPWIAKLANEIEKSHWIKELALRLRVEENAVWKELKKMEHRTVPSKIFSSEGEGTSKIPSRRELLEERVLSLLAFATERMRPRISEGHYFMFTSSLHQELFDHLKLESTSEVLTSIFQERLELFRLKGEILSQMTEDIEDEFTASIRELEKACVKERLFKLGEEIQQKERGGDQKDVRPLLDDFKNFSEMLKPIT